MIPQETVNLILDTAQIVDVVSDYVTLKRRGANFVACCPFHNEKTPSFYVSPSKGIYKCFGCGKAGTAVGFVMEQEHCSYVEALRYLARKYHIEIVEEEESAEEIARTVVTEEERAEVEKRAIDFTKAYALFSLNDDDYRGDVLAYVDRSTPLYQHLAYYNNDWNGTFSNPTYEGMKVSDVKKSASDQNVYTCRVDCVFRFNAGGSHEFNLDFYYTFKRNDNGKLMLTDMQGIEGT